MQILVAEDEPGSRALLTGLLTTMGYQVIGAEDGNEAWQLVSHVHFPVVITDWLMPGLDGLELCRRIRASRRGSYCYLIVLTARDSRTDYLEGMEAGADDFLVKPVDADRLRARIRVAERVLHLERTVHQLRGLLPICIYCQRIHDRDGAGWQPIDRYLVERTNTSLSHGVCPDCADTHLVPAARNGTGG